MANKRFNQITRVVTSFDSNDVLPVGNSTLGDGKMAGDQLLELTAQNALGSIKDLATTKYKGFLALDDADGTGKFDIENLFKSIAPVFDPTRTGVDDDKYHVGDCVMYQGEYYAFMVNHYGAWSSAAVKKLSVTDIVSRLFKRLNTLINENFVRSAPVNLIKRDFLIKGQYVDGSGVIKDSAYWNRTDFIPVTSGEPYKGVGVGLSAFYDADYNFISSVTVSDMSTGVTAPTGAAFLVCSITTADSSTCVLVHGTTIPVNADDGFENFDAVFHKIFDPIFNSSQSIFSWTNITFNAANHTVTFPARTVLQSLLTGKYCLINASAAKTYTLADGHRLVLNTDFSDNVSVNSFDDVVSDVAVATATNKLTLFGYVAGKLISDVPQYEAEISIESSAYLSGMFSTLNGKLGSLAPKGSQSIFAWTDITFDSANYTVTFPARTVLQSLLTGKYCLINASSDKTYSLSDGHRLVLNTDFSDNVSVTNFDNVVSDVAVATATNYVTLFGRLGYLLYSDIPQYQGKINTSGIEASVAPEPPVIVEKLSELAPNTWALLKAQNQDVNIVMIGDSLSTALGYEATERSDAKYRPPLMTEFTYPSYIEEQLRWDGQVYNRFDVEGVFKEVCTSAENLTEDTEHWDWASNNNRPALTRCLSGTNCSVAYEMDEGYVRTDYIYRTDCTNPASASVSISEGNGYVVVYDEANSTWVEANGFTFSAQESSSPIISSYNSTPLMKSMYQKRLKMKWASSPVADCVVTITNNGSGRLTYWGIQKAKRPYMLNFINSSRGGHSTMRLKPFEAWDVDYWQPGLILWEPPYFNHTCVDICGAGYAPITNKMTTAVLLSQMQPYAEALLEKSYSPELVAWSMWVASQASVHSIDQEGNWLFGVASDGSYISAVMYINAIYNMLKSLNVKYINFVPLFRAYGFKYASYRGIQNYENATTVASGKTGKTWTFDGGHLNDLGHELFFKMFGAFFIE